MAFWGRLGCCDSPLTLATSAFGCSIRMIVGVVMNRLNVCLLGLLASSTGYMPRWIEILVSAGVVAGGLLVLSVMNHNLPIVHATAGQASAAGPGQSKTEV